VVLLEVAGDDAMTIGTDGTKLCLLYCAMLSKQLSCPTNTDTVRCLLD